MILSRPRNFWSRDTRFCQSTNLKHFTADGRRCLLPSAVISEAFIESLSKTAETAVFAAVAEAAVAVQVAVAEAEEY